MAYLVRYRDRDVRFESPGGPSIAHYLSAGRFYEPEMLEYIEALQVPGTYVDVGAGVGTHSLFFALYCPATKIHAFEPVAEHHAALAANLAANRNQIEGRVVAHALGLAEAERDGYRRLDDVLDEPISLLKIDVDGMELEVLRGAERLLRRYRPVIFFAAANPEKLGEIAAFLAPIGYEQTGRVFNASATYEAADPASPTVPRVLLPREQALLAPELWHPPGGPVRIGWPEGDGALVGTASVGEGARIHLTHDDLSFEEPPAEGPIVVPGSTVFLQLSGSVEGTAAVAIHVLQYSDGHLLHSERIGSLPRLFRKLELDPGTTAIRLVLRISGKGDFRIDRLSLHERHDQQVDWLRAEQRRVRAQQARDAAEHERRIAVLREEIRTLRGEYQRISLACDEACADAAEQRDLVKAYQNRLAATFKRLESSRASVSFRIGRATKSAVSGARKNLFAAPRRWLDTFRGRDEILEELREASIAARAPDPQRAENARIESAVLLLGLPPSERPTGIAGVVAPRFGAELAASTRFRMLDPHSWRYLLEAEPPAYVLVTADGLAPGSAWAEWGTPGGRDGAAVLRELGKWCRSRRLPLVYWDTIGAGAPLPRGVAFDAVFTVSERNRARLGPAAEVLAPGVEPRVWNPVDVAATAPGHAIYAGGFDRRGDHVELAALAALLAAATGHGLQILDTHHGLAGAGAAAVKLPDAFAALAKRRPAAERERALIKEAGLLVCGGAFAGADFPGWELLRGLALGAHVLATPCELGDRVLAGAVELAGDEAAAALALERLAARPRLDAAWRRGFERVLARYSLRERLDQIARHVGAGPVADSAPSTAVIAHLRDPGDARALRTFLAAQTLQPVDVRVLAERGLDGTSILAEVLDPARIVWAHSSDSLAAGGASHVVCWDAATPALPDAIAELTRIAALGDDAVLALHAEASPATYRYGDLPARAVVAVPRAAAAAELRAGKPLAEIAATLAGRSRCLIAHHAGADRGHHRSVA